MKPCWIGIMLIVIGLSACSSAPSPSSPLPTGVTTNAPVAPPLISTPTGRSLQPTPKPGSSPTPNVSAPIQKTLGGQVVQINAPDLLTVATSTFTLTGQAPSGTVVSANDDFVVVDDSRAFSFDLFLQEGPNLVEIIASNSLGEQVSFEWVVIYEPAP